MIAQVANISTSNSLPAQSVVIPGCLVDYIIQDSDPSHASVGYFTPEDEQITKSWTISEKHGISGLKPPPPLPSEGLIVQNHKLENGGKMENQNNYKTLIARWAVLALRSLSLARGSHGKSAAMIPRGSESSSRYSKHPIYSHMSSSAVKPVTGAVTEPVSVSAAAVDGPMTDRGSDGRHGQRATKPHKSLVVNLGIGIPEGIGEILEELKDTGDPAEGSVNVTLTTEAGVIGGVPAKGKYFGVSAHATARHELTQQFEW